MNIRDLKYFLAVAELEHFGQAAELCHVSQPTLSGQIKKMEETLGIALFERTNRRVILTEIGSHIVEHARNVIKEVDAIYDVSERAGDPLSGKFRLGAFPTLSTYLFPKIVPKVKEVMPNIRLILIEEKTNQLIDRLRKGEIDAALLALPINDDFLVSQQLFSDEFYLAVPEGHELAGNDIVDQTELRQHKLMLLEEGHCLRDQSLEICQLHGVGEDQDFKATGLETLRQMVKVGTGITLIPKIAMRDNDEGIRYIRFKQPAPNRKIGLVWRKTTHRQQVINQLIGITK
jgi:LysR family hydrogen peroxide-inducible transcriptional activator